jgi:hypothetical protein
VVILLWFATWTAQLAYFQREYPSVACESYRRDLGMSMLIAFFPPMWLITPFVTGFYKHGFQMMPNPDCPKKNR